MHGEENKRKGPRTGKPLLGTLLTVIGLSWLVLSLPAIADEPAPDSLHAPWNALLKELVHPARDGATTQVDYAGFKEQKSELTAYLSQLAAVSKAEYENWEKPHQLAFLINAYNAYTVLLIVNHYPNIESIKDTGSLFSSPWSKDFARLLGQKRSLDNIEHGWIRGAQGDYPGFEEPRIHFAVNCASIGCPSLRTEAYTGERLNEQLEAQTRQFLSDRTRNRADNTTLHVSSIFKWYDNDFQHGWQGIESLAEFFMHYADALNLDETQRSKLQNGELDIQYLPYNWALNEFKK